VLNLYLNYDKHNSYDNSTFLKNEKYFIMFWLYFFEKSRLNQYFYNVFGKGYGEAHQLIQTKGP